MVSFRFKKKSDIFAKNPDYSGFFIMYNTFNDKKLFSIANLLRITKLLLGFIMLNIKIPD